MVKTYLINYLMSNKFISSVQHGFLSRLSTCTNLLEAVNDWTEGLDASRDTLVFYIDFARAFDSVSIPKLVHKLECIGVGGKLLSCIKSLL